MTCPHVRYTYDSGGTAYCSLNGAAAQEVERLRAEVDRLTKALDAAQLHSIEASNPGIDMDAVREYRLHLSNTSGGPR